MSKPSILERIFSRPGPEKRDDDQVVRLTDSNIARWLGLGSYNSVTEITITDRLAMEVAAFGAAVNFIAGTIAGLPLHVYETKLKDGTSKKSNKRINTILHRAPNSALSSFEWRRFMMINALVYGRHVSYIERDPDTGEVLNIFPIAPAALKIEGSMDKRRYIVKTGNNTYDTYKAEEVIDIAFTYDQNMINHIGPMDLAKNALGFMLAAEKYGAKVFQNGGLPPIVVQGPFQSVAAAERAAEDIPKAMADKHGKGKQALVMPAGHEVKPIGFNAKDMQLIDLKRFCVEEIARVFSLPPTFLQDLTNGTHSNSEQQDLHFVKHTVKRWTEQIEAELNLKLWGRFEKKHYAEFNLDGLLRGDFKTRMDGFASAVQNGIRTPNEVRALENLPPVEGGDVAYIQGASMPLKNQQNAQLNNPDNAVSDAGDGSEGDGGGDDE